VYPVIGADSRNLVLSIVAVASSARSLA